MCLSDSIAGFRVFRHGHGPARSGSSLPRSHRYRAAISPVTLTSGFTGLCGSSRRSF